MKELLMSKPNGGESSIIRADITVGIRTTEEGTGYGYSNIETSSVPKFGQCSNSKINALFSQDSPPLTELMLTTPLVTSNVTITRLDTAYSISAHDADTTKELVIIGLLFTQQDIDKTIPIEIRFA